MTVPLSSTNKPIPSHVLNEAIIFHAGFYSVKKKKPMVSPLLNFHLIASKVRNYILTYTHFMMMLVFLNDI